MDLHLSVYEIMLRLFLAMVMGGGIGIEREYKNRPAGIRTHILVVSNRSVKGLTTAASIWAGAGLGIAIGMGYYTIAICSFVGIMLALTVVKRIIKINSIKKLEIRYIHREATKEFIMNYFDSKKIEVEDVDFDVDFMDDYRIYTNVYTIDLPRGLNYTEVIEDLSMYKNITKLRMINV